MSATTNTQRPYEYLNDEALRAHYESVLDQGESVADELRLRAGQKSTSVWSTWTLADIASELHRLADSDLQSLVTAWSTHGGLISAELARRSEAKRMTVSSEQWAEHLERNPMAGIVGGPSAFADMLKANNRHDGPLDRLLKDIAEEPDEPPATVDEPEPPEDFSMFSIEQLARAREGEIAQFEEFMLMRGLNPLRAARITLRDIRMLDGLIKQREDAQ